MSEVIIQADKSISFAADVEPELYGPVVAKLGKVEGVDSIKIGFEVALGLSLPVANHLAKEANPDIVTIYDHQKGGNDIPATGMNFGRAMKRGGVDAAILFPFAGPKTQEAWTKSLQDEGIGVITGAEMTHEEMHTDVGGYVSTKALRLIFQNAIEWGVTDFVVPGNKVESVLKWKELFDERLGEGLYTLYAPGFVDQGGDVTETGTAAGNRLVAIVGGGIYKSDDPAVAAGGLVRALRAS